MRGAGGAAARVLRRARPAACVVDADGGDVRAPEVAVARQRHPLRLQQAPLVSVPCHLRSDISNLVIGRLSRGYLWVIH